MKLEEVLALENAKGNLHSKDYLAVHLKPINRAGKARDIPDMPHIKIPSSMKTVVLRELTSQAKYKMGEAADFLCDAITEFGLEETTQVAPISPNNWNKDVLHGWRHDLGAELFSHSESDNDDMNE
eukprot:5583684-Ditylum_brightwellii.AAC.1